MCKLVSSLCVSNLDFASPRVRSMVSKVQISHSERDQLACFLLAATREASFRTFCSRPAATERKAITADQEALSQKATLLTQRGSSRETDTLEDTCMPESTQKGTTLLVDPEENAQQSQETMDVPPLSQEEIEEFKEMLASGEMSQEEYDGITQEFQEQVHF